MKKLAAFTAAALLVLPMVALIAVGVLMNPAASAACRVGNGGLVVGRVPKSLRVTTADGTSFTLNKQQLTHAATIITVGGGIGGVGRDGIQIALMAALTESTLRMLANTSAYPSSGNYPNDGNGSDHDSLGLFQMRPASGWGSVAQLMDSEYQARAFYGGSTGPNYPSPRGLLDIPGWQQMDKGEAAQAVEVSAYPDRYQAYEPVAEEILAALTRPDAPAASSGIGLGGGLLGSSRVVLPLPEGTWVMVSAFGMRVHPITGETRLHAGADFAAPEGTPILAAADGTVTGAGSVSGYGGLVVIEHTFAGLRVATAYAHMWPPMGIHVRVGDRVRAGQHIGDVGSAGGSTGPHLHFEVRPGGTNGAPIDPVPWLNAHGAANLPAATSGGSSSDCAPNPSTSTPVSKLTGAVGVRASTETDAGV